MQIVDLLNWRLALLIFYVTLFLWLFRANRYFSTYLLLVGNHFTTLVSIFIIGVAGDLVRPFLDFPVNDDSGNGFLIYMMFCLSTMLLYYFLMRKLGRRYKLDISRLKAPWFSAYLSRGLCHGADSSGDCARRRRCESIHLP